MTTLIKIYSVSVMWLIFTILFLLMAWREWQKSKESLKSLKPLPIGEAIILGVDFVSMVEKIKHEFNEANKESRRIAATAYFLQD